MEAAGFCPESAEVDSAVRGDLRSLATRSKFACARFLVPDKKTTDTPNTRGKGTAMNVETVELKAVAEVAKTDEAIELLTLSLDDLDIVAGGASLGALC
jgi:hypothetical protein